MHIFGAYSANAWSTAKVTMFITKAFQLFACRYWIVLQSGLCVTVQACTPPSWGFLFPAEFLNESHGFGHGLLYYEHDKHFLLYFLILHAISCTSAALVYLSAFVIYIFVAPFSRKKCKKAVKEVEIVVTLEYQTEVRISLKTTTSNVLWAFISIFSRTLCLSFVISLIRLTFNSELWEMSSFQCFPIAEMECREEKFIFHPFVTYFEFSAADEFFEKCFWRGHS